MVIHHFLWKIFYPRVYQMFFHSRCKHIPNVLFPEEQPQA